MSPLLELPLVRDLHERSLLFPMIVVLVVAVVLLQGVLAPKPAEGDEGGAQLSPPPPPLVRPELEKTPLAYAEDYWLQLGERLQPRFVLIGRDHVPGIVMARGLVLTSIQAADDVVAEAMALGSALAGSPSESELQPADRTGAAAEAPSPEASGTESPKTEGGQASESETEDPPQRPAASYAVVGVDTDWGLGVLRLADPSSGAAFPAPVPREWQAGAHVAAISLTPDQHPRITRGVLVSVPPENDYSESGSFADAVLDVSIPFPGNITVAAIVDLDGGLLGIAIGAGGGVKVLSAARAARIAEELSERRFCVALETRDLDEDLRRLLRLGNGVFVERVRKESFFPEPSLRGGDILLRWGGTEITSREQFEQVYGEHAAGALVRFQVLRDGRRVRGATRMPDPDCRPAASTLVRFPRLGIIANWESGAEEDSSGWRVLHVFEASPASAAGVERRDRIVGVAGRPLTLSQPRRGLQEFERRPRPAVLTLLRAGRRKLLAVKPKAG